MGFGGIPYKDVFVSLGVVSVARGEAEGGFPPGIGKTRTAVNNAVPYMPRLKNGERVRPAFRGLFALASIDGVGCKCKNPKDPGIYHVNRIKVDVLFLRKPRLRRYLFSHNIYQNTTRQSKHARGTGPGRRG